MRAGMGTTCWSQIQVANLNEFRPRVLKLYRPINFPLERLAAETPRENDGTFAGVHAALRHGGGGGRDEGEERQALATMTAPELETIAPVTSLSHGVQPFSRSTK